MSLSVGSVSSVNFRGSEMLERPGKYAAQTFAPEESPAKKGSVAKKVVGFIGTVAVLAAAIVGLTKGKVVNKLSAEAFKDAGIIQKASHYLATAGEYISKYTWDKIAPVIRKTTYALKKTLFNK